MATPFNGKLIELKTGNSYVELPLKYIKAESYQITPHQRMESSANRATTGVLVRNTVDHTASKIEFNTPPVTINAINTLLGNAYTDAKQRKLDLRYYDPSTDDYKEGTFYVPDIDFPITRVEVTAQVVHYDSIRFAFIEY